MKIAYVNFLLSKHPMIGMEKKLIEQAKTATELNLNIDFWYFGLHYILKDKNVKFYKIGDSFFSTGFFLFHRYKKMLEIIDSDQYDLIVLVYRNADLSIFSRRFRKNLSKIITEHHTKEEFEIKHFRISFFVRLLFLIMEKLLAPEMLKRVRGIIGVTDEITLYEAKRSDLSLPHCTIPNGIRTKDTPFTGHASYDGKVLNLLFIASSIAPWHGLDRIFRGLKDYKSKNTRVKLNIVGDISKAMKQYNNFFSRNRCVELKLLGILHGKELEEVFQNSHLAFTSLGLYKNNMKEAATLKTRQYMARGLPFIIGYDDPDLEGDFKFMLRVEQNSTPIDMESVIRFADKVLLSKDVSEQMRSYSEKYLDWKIKITKLWCFAEDLLR